MNTTQFIQLRKDCFEAIKNKLPIEETTNICVLLELKVCHDKKYIVNPIFIDLYKGIIGYLNWVKANDENIENYIQDIFHDLNGSLKEDEDFVPRTSSYIKFYESIDFYESMYEKVMNGKQKIEVDAEDLIEKSLQLLDYSYEVKDGGCKISYFSDDRSYINDKNLIKIYYEDDILFCNVEDAITFEEETIELSEISLDSKIDLATILYDLVLSIIKEQSQSFLSFNTLKSQLYTVHNEFETAIDMAQKLDEKDQLLNIEVEDIKDVHLLVKSI